MTPVEMPAAAALSLPQISALVGEFRSSLLPVAMVAMSNLKGQPASPHESDVLPVIGVLPAFANRLIETACSDVDDASALPLPMRAELLGRIVRLVMERHSQTDVMLAASVAMMPNNTRSGGLN